MTYSDILFKEISTLTMRVLKEANNGIKRKNEDNIISSYASLHYNC